ncbi:MAG TPA: hypothetical protein ENH97_03790 [bacterium]|nr:hypothetical protein [bacterium]
MKLSFKKIAEAIEIRSLVTVVVIFTGVLLLSKWLETDPLRPLIFVTIFYLLVNNRKLDLILIGPGKTKKEEK